MPPAAPRPAAPMALVRWPHTRGTAAPPAAQRRAQRRSGRVQSGAGRRWAAINGRAGMRCGNSACLGSHWACGEAGAHSRASAGHAGLGILLAHCLQADLWSLLKPYRRVAGLLSPLLFPAWCSRDAPPCGSCEPYESSRAHWHSLQGRSRSQKVNPAAPPQWRRRWCPPAAPAPRRHRFGLAQRCMSAACRYVTAFSSLDRLPSTATCALLVA